MRLFSLIFIFLLLNSCYSLRESFNVCNCKTVKKSKEIDSVRLDSLVFYFSSRYPTMKFYPYLHKFDTDTAVIDFASKFNGIRRLYNKDSLNNFDSVIRNINCINDILMEKEVLCKRSKKTKYMVVTDVYILYYSVKGVKKEIQISYFKNLSTSNKKVLYLNGLENNRYKCPKLLQNLKNLFVTIYK